ncbi:hypothetical protein ACIBQX_35860 [Nonomuraea sp. NPDC049714]|uniref:hypothetical protein n=1 Tax=Nonomuraea sp. NPDC049714 TaxID=3364357 RepID=UPI00379768D9
MPIVMIGVFVQHGAKLPFAEDRQSVGALRARCGPIARANAFARAMGRDLQHVNVVACEDFIEAVGDAFSLNTAMGAASLADQTPAIADAGVLVDSDLHEILLCDLPGDG